MLDQAEVAIRVAGREQHVAEAQPLRQRVEFVGVRDRRKERAVLGRGVQDEARVDVRPQPGDRERQVAAPVIRREHRPRCAASRQPARRLGREVEWRRRGQGRLATEGQRRDRQLGAQQRRGQQPAQRVGPQPASTASGVAIQYSSRTFRLAASASPTKPISTRTCDSGSRRRASSRHAASAARYHLKWAMASGAKRSSLNGATFSATSTPNRLPAAGDSRASKRPGSATAAAP